MRVDFGFVFRTIMDTHAGLVVCAILLAVGLTCSWALHSCESASHYQTRNFVEALWMIIITFTTVRATCGTNTNGLKDGVGDGDGGHAIR